VIDWNWIIQICDFKHTLVANAFSLTFEKEMSIFTSVHTGDVHYLAPECFGSITGFPGTINLNVLGRKESLVPVKKDQTSFSLIDVPR
jgi:hypothetical protein